jgi:hypothetical protein
MFGMLTRTRNPRTRPPRPIRLGLEVLEARDTPSTLTLGVTYGHSRSITLQGTLDGPAPAGHTISIMGQASGQVTTDPWGHFSITLNASGLGLVMAMAADGSSNMAQLTLTDTVPVINSFDAIEGPGNIWTLRGTVTYNRYPEDLVVNFGGQPVSLQGKSIECGYDGSYSLAVQLNGTTTDNGAAVVGTMSPYGLLADTRMDVIHQTGT